MSTYELAYLEENHTDGSVKHTYIEPAEEEPVAKPLDPNDDPVYEVIEDFLSYLSIQPSVLILRDLLVEQSITINCTKADDLPGVITKVLLEETSPVHYLYSIPSAKALIVGVELHRCRLSPDQLYRIDGAKIVKAD
ncbi:hypothetical protein [Defluviitalea phaphyphila]|uniref:hypothetical protein n=1 Tax=Defluviitalea phaphyphila TaxID=1473580 RepID=UPI0007309BCE|nr:hypothetical protein [Defluviitalea phaphyphila]